MDLTEAEDTKKRWQEYTEELYKKDLHDPDNHDIGCVLLVYIIADDRIKGHPQCQHEQDHCQHDCDYFSFRVEPSIPGKPRKEQFPPG